MKKPNKRDTVNLFFSAFLVLALIVCAHFFTKFTASISATLSAVISIILFVIFGLLLFYATRVGDGKAVKRFSIVTLIAMVIIPLYIVIASIAPGMPFNESFASSTGNASMIVALAGVALGYGIPYSFISGFEIANDNNEIDTEETQVLEGGIEADILEEATDNADDEVDSE